MTDRPAPDSKTDSNEKSKPDAGATLPLWPFQALDAALGFVEARLAPPEWLVAELQQRIVLLLNHVLQSEPEAMARLKRQKGKRVVVAWRSFSMGLVATPVGLLDRFDPSKASAKSPDLSLTLTQTSIFDLAQTAHAGTSPKLRIEGDVQLAAEIGWLTQNVRWDIEEDLSKVMGDAGAHTLVQAVKTMAKALQGMAVPGAASATSSSSSSDDAAKTSAGTV